MKVGIIGASGFVGGELLRLLINHSQVELTIATSRTYEGQFLSKIRGSIGKQKLNKSNEK